MESCSDCWLILKISQLINNHLVSRQRRILNSVRRGRDRMVVGFTTTYAISAYLH
jgi:hypothetical protein